MQIYPVAEWIETIRPIIEKTLGPLPPFEVRPGRLPASYVRMKVFVPFTAGWYPDDDFVGIKYYPRHLGDRLRTDPGYVLYGIAHEPVHVYQRSNTEMRWLSDDRKEWLEGVAELAGLKILTDLLKEKTMLRELIDDAVGTRRYSETVADLEDFIGRNIANSVYAGARCGIIPKYTIRELILPFRLPRVILHIAKKELRALKKENAPIPWLQYNLPYRLGLIRCARIVASGTLTFPEIIRIPLTRRRLKELAGV